jgi:hypothetical protein
VKIIGCTSCSDNKSPHIKIMREFPLPHFWLGQLRNKIWVVSKTTTFLSELVLTGANLYKPQAQPAMSKFWQVHTANFFYGPPFWIHICIIQNASTVAQKTVHMFWTFSKMLYYVATTEDKPRCKCIKWSSKLELSNESSFIRFDKELTEL